MSPSLLLPLLPQALLLHTVLLAAVPCRFGWCLAVKGWPS